MQERETQRVEIELVSFRALIRSHFVLINGTINENALCPACRMLAGLARLWLSASIKFVGVSYSCGKIYIYVRL